MLVSSIFHIKILLSIILCVTGFMMGSFACNNKQSTPHMHYISMHLVDIVLSQNPEFKSNTHLSFDRNVKDKLQNSNLGS